MEKIENIDTKIIVEKSVLPKQTIHIKGKDIIFNTIGLSKKEIIEIDPFIINFKISLDKTLKINQRSNDFLKNSNHHR